MVEITVRPLRASLFRKRIKLRDVVESKPVVGSSKKIIDGLISSSKPIEQRFFQPPETPLILVSPIQVSLHFQRPKFLMTELTRLSLSSSDKLGSLRSATNLNDSQGVKVGKIKSSCITQPTQLLQSPMLLVLLPLMTKSPIISRLLDCWRPEMRFSMVVLPQPEGPRMAVKVPGLNLPEHDFKIYLTPSTFLVLPFSQISFSMIALTLMSSQASSISGTGSKCNSSSGTSSSGPLTLISNSAIQSFSDQLIQVKVMLSGINKGYLLRNHQSLLNNDKSPPYSSLIILPKSLNSLMTKKQPQLKSHQKKVNLSNIHSYLLSLISFILISQMIAEEVQDIFVERPLIVRQENIARRNYKIVNWLKLLTLHQQNKNKEACDEIIKNQMHQNFVMQESFWLEEAAKIFVQDEVKRQDIDLLMLGLEDGNYAKLASAIAEQIMDLYKQKKLRQNYVLSILQKLINQFSFDSTSSKFFAKVRSIYSQSNAIPKIRSAFERQLKLAHDDFDLVWDEYKLWQPDAKKLNFNQELYSEAKKLWEKRAVDFDDNLCSQSNVKLSLNNLQDQNQSKIQEGQYIEWLEKLPTESQKLWYLRRMALNYRQLFKPYLLKLQSVYQNDDQTLIKKYKVVIRLSQNDKQIQLKYLHFLIRRISKHLLNETLSEQYNQSWGNNVGFFRDQITSLIEKTRIGISQEAISAIFREYYMLWIEVEERITKHKESMCQLYENLIKQTLDYSIYEDYAKSLMNLGAVKEAKNVLKRYVHHTSDGASRQKYLSFIQMYGSVEDQVQYYKECIEGQKKKLQAEIQQAKVLEKQVPQMFRPTKQPVGKNLSKQSVQPGPLPIDDTKGEAKDDSKLKRAHPTQLTQLQDKIYDNMRKRLHVDGQHTVYLKGIPTDWVESDVLKILKYPEEVVLVRLVAKDHKQKDYCYIEYKSKEVAEKEVQENKSEYKFYISKPPAQYDQRNTLFVCALPQTVNEEKIRELFGEDRNSIVDIRLKLDKDKNYAYVQFESIEAKEKAFEQVKKHDLIIDGKKIIVQYCDSNRAKTKKFIPVVFLKNLAFKAQEKDIRQFFEGKNISKLSIPLNQDNRTQGFAYVQFEKFKDYQDALDMKRGKILGRQMQILRSDRQITDPHHHRPHPKKDNQEHNDRQKTEEHQKGRQSKGKYAKKGGSKRPEEPQVKDNNFFSNLFK